MKIELRLDLEDIVKEVFEIKSYHRARIPTEIDGELYDIEYGVEIHEQITSGDFMVGEIWIEQLDNAPEFKLTNKLKEQIKETILYAPEDWKGTPVG